MISPQFSCVCGTATDQKGHHALTCPKIKSRFQRHSMCNTVIKEAFHATGTQSTLEPIGLLTNDGRRPDGITLTIWHRGKPVAWDFTCVHCLAASHIRIATTEGPVVANEAEIKKRSHYNDLPDNCTFEHVAIETLGGISQTSIKFLQAEKSENRQVKRDPSYF